MLHILQSQMQWQPEVTASTFSWAHPYTARGRWSCPLPPHTFWSDLGSGKHRSLKSNSFFPLPKYSTLPPSLLAQSASFCLLRFTTLESFLNISVLTTFFFRILNTQYIIPSYGDAFSVSIFCITDSNDFLKSTWESQLSFFLNVLNLKNKAIFWGLIHDFGTPRCYMCQSFFKPSLEALCVDCREGWGFSLGCASRKEKVKA